MEEKLCNTIQEFEDIFGNVPFKDLDKIKKYIKNNFVPISVIENEIEELSAMKLTDTIAKAEVNFAIVTLEDIIYEERRRNNKDV